jgi:hypothetical protein
MALVCAYEHPGDIKAAYVEVGRRHGFSPEYSYFCRRLRELLEVYPSIGEWCEAFYSPEEKAKFEEVEAEFKKEWAEKQRSNDDAS